MDLIREKLIKDLQLENPCPICIICSETECEWDDGDGENEPYHRERILEQCYEKVVYLFMLNGKRYLNLVWTLVKKMTIQNYLN